MKENVGRREVEVEETLDALMRLKQSPRDKLNFMYLIGYLHHRIGYQKQKNVIVQQYSKQEMSNG